MSSKSVLSMEKWKNVFWNSKGIVDKTAEVTQ